MSKYLLGAILYMDLCKMLMVFHVHSDNPSLWLQKYESVVTERIKLIHPVIRKQGFCVNTEDRLATGENVRYVMLLYDEKRTENFLSFIRGTN